MGTEAELIKEMKDCGFPTRRVRVKHNKDHDWTYLEEARPKRKAGDGKVGTIFASHNSHGLCFEVKFDGLLAGHATYEPDELTPEP